MMNALKLAGGGRVAVPLLRLSGGSWMTPAVARGLAWAARRFPIASRDTHTHTHTHTHSLARTRRAFGATRWHPAPGLSSSPSHPSPPADGAAAWRAGEPSLARPGAVRAARCVTRALPGSLRRRGRFALVPGARLAMPLLAALSLFAAAPAQAQTEVWSATLTVSDHGGNRGCIGATHCSNQLSDNSFTHGGETFTVTSIPNVQGILAWRLDKTIPDSLLNAATLRVDTTDLALSAANLTSVGGVTNNQVTWSTTLSWTVNQQVSLRLTLPSTPTTPTTPPKADPGISTDAALRALTVTTAAGAPVALSPAFSKRRVAPFVYTAAVPWAVTHVTLTATARHSRHRRLTVNGEWVASGRAGEPIALAPGVPAVMTIEITAEDYETTKTYTVAIARARAEGAPLGVTVAPALVRPAAADDPATAETDERRTRYRVRLPWQPLGPVTVTPASSAPAIAAVSGPLHFTPENWDTPQAVTVAGMAAGRAEIAHRIRGGGYDDAAVPVVTVIVGDGGHDPRKQVKPCPACADTGNAGPDNANAPGTDSPDGAPGHAAGDGDDSMHAAPPRAPDGALAALARGHLASARQVLGQRLDAAADTRSRLTLGGRTLTLAQLLGPGPPGAAVEWDRPPAEAGLSGDGQCASLPAAACAWPGMPGLDTPGAWESLLYGLATGLGRSGAESLLQGGGFVLTLGGADESGQAGQAGPGRRWTLWGRGDAQALPGLAAAGADAGHGLSSGYLGLDTRLNDHWLAGLAVARSRWAAGHEVPAGDGGQAVPHPRLGRGPAALTTAYPYLAWSNGAASVTAQAGLGRGEVRHHAAPGASPARIPLELRLGMVDAGHRLGAWGGAEVGLRMDAAWAQLTRGDGPRAQTESVRQARLGATAAWTWQGPGGLTLAPAGEVHWRHDGGDGPSGRGLELGAGLRAARGPVRLAVQGRHFAARADRAWREQGLEATLNVGQPGNTGGSLTLASGWGAGATAGHTLWQESLAYPRRSGALTPTPWTLDAKAGYGLRLPGGRLLTWFGHVGHAAYGHHVLLGLRLGHGAAPAPW